MLATLLASGTGAALVPLLSKAGPTGREPGVEWFGETYRGRRIAGSRSLNAAGSTTASPSWHVTVDGDPSDTPARVRDAIAALPWVDSVDVRLREEGHVFSGEAFVVLAVQADVPGQLRRMSEQLCSLDWRLHEVVVMPVASLDEL